MLDPCAPGNVYSVTELEKAAECPFRFFLKRGLGVRPVDERERDRTSGSTRSPAAPNCTTSMPRSCARTRDENRRPDAEGCRLAARATRRTGLAQLHEEMPAATPEILERETQDFLADVELFLEAEIEDDATDAVGLEVSFGRPLDGDEEPLARAEPVEIGLGAGLTLRIAGRIDRIDEVGAATFEVLDYKTGGFWRDSWKGVFAGGQPPAARALWAGRGRTAQGPPQEAEGRGGRLLLLQPQGTAASASGSRLPRSRRSRRCWATCAT